MKKLILLLFIATSFNTFAGNPKNGCKTTTKITKETYVLTPQPTDPSNKPLECCRKHAYGYDITGCYNIMVECWGECGEHGYMVTVCPGGVVEIRGARIAAGYNDPIKLKLPLTIGLIDLKNYTTNQDIVSQLISFDKKKNSVITIDTDLKFETEEYTMIILKGQYQIENSKLLVLVNR